MKQKVLGVMFIAGTCVAAQGDDALMSLASVSEESEMLVGPNVGATALPVPQATDAERRVHATVGLDVTNAYFSRGLRQEDRGIIFQPYGTFGLDVVKSDSWNLEVYAGMWHSVHDRKTNAGTSDGTLAKWYEADAYFGANVGMGDWTVGVQYGWFLSPGDAFTTVEELQVAASYDDSAVLGAWALSPSALLVIETGDGTSDGLEKGGYLQLGVEPGIDIEDGGVKGLRLSVPVVLGVSAWDYYEDAQGDNFYGFTSVGVKASYALHSSEQWGEASCYAACNLLHLGDLASTVNDDEETALVVSAGVAFSF